MTQPRIHEEDTAPAAARPLLAAARRAFGFVPNLLGVLAETPSVLEGYMGLSAAFDKTSFTPAERQVVALTVSYFHGCAYCMSAHSMLAAMAGLGPDDLDALRSGRSLADPRLEALRSFTRRVLVARGALAAPDIDTFVAAGFSRSQVAEVVLGVAFKTLSNYTHHLLPFPVDAQFAGYAWTTGEATDTKVLIAGWTRPEGSAALSDYVRAAGPIMQRHGGQALLRSKPQTALAGDLADLVVLMQFPSSESAAAAFADADYQALRPLRDQAFSRIEVIDLGGGN